MYRQECLGQIVRHGSYTGLCYTSLMDIHIGTSGWHYNHWRGLFYPEGLNKPDWLPFYSRHFDTLEINVTFYRNVESSTYTKWRNAVPDHFLFSIKMSRFITHIKKLRIDSHSINHFKASIRYLQDRLGIVLIQLPPGLKFDEGLIRDFLYLLDKGLRYTVEARNESFIDDRFFALLEEYGVAWCVADSAGRFPYYEAVTAPFVYIRLHGSQELYASDYKDSELELWRDKIALWGKETFVYFDNDFHGYAVIDAKKLKALVSNI